MTGPVLTGKPVVSTWVTDLFEPENQRIRFVIFIGDSAVLRFTIRLTNMTDFMTTMDMDFELTAMGKDVISIEEKEIKNRLLGIGAFLSQSLKHYCETGTMLKANP